MTTSAGLVTCSSAGTAESLPRASGVTSTTTPCSSAGSASSCRTAPARIALRGAFRCRRPVNEISRRRWLASHSSRKLGTRFLQQITEQQGPERQHRDHGWLGLRCRSENSFRHSADKRSCPSARSRRQLLLPRSRPQPPPVEGDDPANAPDLGVLRSTTSR